MSMLTLLGGMPVAFIAASLIGAFILHGVAQRTPYLVLSSLHPVLYCTTTMLVFGALPFGLVFTSLTIPIDEAKLFVFFIAVAYGVLSIAAFCCAISILIEMYEESESSTKVTTLRVVN